jgi:hypothetical protein
MGTQQSVNRKRVRLSGELPSRMTLPRRVASLLACVAVALLAAASAAAAAGTPADRAEIAALALGQMALPASCTPRITVEIAEGRYAVAYPDWARSGPAWQQSGRCVRYIALGRYPPLFKKTAGVWRSVIVRREDERKIANGAVICGRTFAGIPLAVMEKFFGCSP